MSKKAVIQKATMAGHNHQVITLRSESKAYRREPCTKCPWRKDATGEFPAEAFRLSASTAYDAAFNSFACHDSGRKTPATCAGFLLRNANNNIGVRIQMMEDRYDFNQISDGGHELYESYRAMAIGNGVSPDDPVLAKCRNNDGSYT